VSLSTSSHIAAPAAPAADEKDGAATTDYLAYQTLLGTDNAAASSGGGTQDAFAAQRNGDATDAQNESAVDDTANGDADADAATRTDSLSPPNSPGNRRMSREWGNYIFLPFTNPRPLRWENGANGWDLRCLESPTLAVPAAQGQHLQHAIQPRLAS
jgi:hypothetical protein